MTATKNDSVADYSVFGSRDLTNDNRAEREALAHAEREMAKLEAEFPEWWAFYDEVMPDIAPRADVVELLRTAPNDAARMLIYGKFTMRLEIAAITKRPWR